MTASRIILFPWASQLNTGVKRRPISFLKKLQNISDRITYSREISGYMLNAQKISV